MPFNDSIKDRELHKFLNLDGETAVRVFVGNGEGDPIPTTNTETTIIQYNEITSVASSIESTIVSYTVPATNNWKLKAIHFNGNNVATYSLKINATTKQKETTYYTKYNGMFLFESGLSLSSGDVVTLTVIHTRPYVGQFNASLLLSETL